MLPKYFAVYNSGYDPQWKEYIQWLNKTYNQDWNGDTSKYYGYDGSMSFNGTVHSDKLENFKNNPHIFNSAKEFFETLNEEEFILPKKWAISAYGNVNKLTIIDKWFNDNVRQDICSNTKAFFHFPELEKGKICTGIYCHKGYKEINFETFEKYVLKEQEEKIYTIEDLAEGRVQLKFDRKDKDLLKTIIRKAFPKDSTPNADSNYYYKYENGKWGSSKMAAESLPIQHISKFKLIEEKPKEMNYTINKVQLKEIHDIACSTWKAKIKEYATQDPFADNITFSEKQVKEMFDAATKEQLPTLKSIFKDYNKDEINNFDDVLRLTKGKIFYTEKQQEALRKATLITAVYNKGDVLDWSNSSQSKWAPYKDFSDGGLAVGGWCFCFCPVGFYFVRKQDAEDAIKKFPEVYNDFFGN